MADEPNSTAMPGETERADAPRADAPRGDTARSGTEHSGFSRSASSTALAGRTTGGSGVQRSHLRDRKTWLKKRTRAGRTWAQRKAASITYCPAVVKRG